MTTDKRSLVIKAVYAISDACFPMKEAEKTVSEIKKQNRETAENLIKLFQPEESQELCSYLRAGFTLLESENAFGVKPDENSPKEMKAIYRAEKLRRAKFFHRAYKAIITPNNGLELSGYGFGLKQVKGTVILPVMEQIENLLIEQLDVDVQMLNGFRDAYKAFKVRQVARRATDNKIAKARKKARDNARMDARVEMTKNDILNDMLSDTISQKDFLKKLESLKKQVNQ